ncbi:MAG: error-prone DNA polymerase [Aestuariivirgaceae bacterium]
MTTGFAELQAFTNFTFLEGGSHAEELVGQAKHLGLAALAVTDRNSMAGLVRAHASAKANGVKFIPGVRLDLMERETLPLAGFASLLAWPRDRAAYGRLTRLVSRGQRRAAKGKCILTLDDVAEFQEGSLFAIVPPPGLPKPPFLAAMAAIRSRIDQPVHLAASMLRKAGERARLNALAEAARKHRTPLIATNDVLYHHPDRRMLQDVLTCIREKCTIAEAGFRLEANSERHLKPAEEMLRLFRGHEQAVERTVEIAERLSFSLAELHYEYPDEPVPAHLTPQEHLTELTWAGAGERYSDGIPAKVRAMLEKELALIDKLDYARYFLTVHDIVRFARSREQPILCQGRGSAANSAVCYCLGVTAVDPTEIDLLFERFLSEERKEPPDIDIDFEHERREEVIQYLYDRYGRERAGLAATVISYRGRSAVREVGKAMGLSEDVTAALAGTLWGGPSQELTEARLEEKGLEPGDPLLSQVIALAEEIIGFPRHLSQHVGGFVLTKRRLDETVPIGNAAMEDRTVIEWDKDDIDELGILKVDVLGLGMLTCIRKCFALIAGWHRAHYTLASVPREDPEVYEMLCRADSIGVFQVESRAQMNMLPRLRPKSFYDLVIEVAIVRPGPIQGDMVHPYLRRRQGLEAEEYPAPDPAFGNRDELYAVLGKTKGVPLFQEQAMKLAMVAADFTPGELNELRKAMATFKRRGTIGRLEQKMIARMVERGYERGFAERCFNQIKGFGEYGFPESHAASFAHLVYVSAWIKCRYPAAFAAGLLNSQPMGFYAPAQIVRDAAEHGVPVSAPDVNRSDFDATLTGEGAQPVLQLGLRSVDGLKEADGRLVATRRGARPYDSLTTLRQRTGIAVHSIERLAAADAFRSLGIDRRQALWQAKALSRAKPLPLFAAQGVEGQGGEGPVTLPEMPLSEQVVNDYQTLKLSLKGHPMGFLREDCRAIGVTDMAALKGVRNNAPVTVAGVVLVRQRPGSAEGVVFITLEDEFSIANIVVWPKTLETCRAAVMGARLMLIKGQVQRQDDIVHVIARRIEDLSHWLARLAPDDLLVNPVARADEVKRGSPGGSRPQLARHPRQNRIIPKSRDFQ